MKPAIHQNTPLTDNPLAYAGYRFPPEVISYAVWLNYRFPLSLRMVEELLAARGIELTYETVPRWAVKFGLGIARRIRSTAPARGDKWHLDEVVVTVRAACEAWGVRPATVFRAYYLVENRGMIKARPRSDYFVSPTSTELARQRSGNSLGSNPKTVNISDLVFEVLKTIRQAETVPLGSAFLSPALFPMARVGKSCATANRSTHLASMVDGLPPGHEGLRQQISLRYLMAGMTVPVDEIIITSGALEALTLSAHLLAAPGDVIVIEKPTFYAALQAIERLKLNVVEIPVDPVEGHDLDALARALQQHPVRACWFMTSFHNPTGVTLDDSRKQALVDLLARHDVPLIEDDVYNELHFGPDPVRPAKFFDRKGLVIH
jgi:DNA-binding transcriptional MocR family regulator